MAWLSGALAVLITISGCGDSAPDSPPILDQAKYALGEEVSLGTNDGTYCATLDSDGTPTYPGARSFTVAVADHPLASTDCEPVVRFFKDYLAAGAPMTPVVAMSQTFNGVIVADEAGFADRPPGYTFVTLGAAEAKPYGEDMRGFAIIADEVDVTVAPVPPTTTLTDSANAFRGECGSIRVAETDTFHGVEVSGSVGCEEANSTLNRYTMDPGLAKHGETQAAEFNGWSCETGPGAENDAFVMRCTRGSDVIRAR